MEEQRGGAQNTPSDEGETLRHVNLSTAQVIAECIKLGNQFT